METAEPDETIFLPARVFADVAARLSFPRDDKTRDAPASRLRPAAVLVGLVGYDSEVKVLLTRRSAGLRVHSGQIAFPGGRIESGDASPVAAALREAQEEIGLDPSHVEPLGCLDPYPTGTGFRIIPVVAKIAPPFVLAINPHEVEDTFEVPYAFLMNADNHSLLERDVEGGRRLFYAMPYAERYIWGVTAGILRNLYERLYC